VRYCHALKARNRAVAKIGERCDKRGAGDEQQELALKAVGIVFAEVVNKKEYKNHA
jgi:hypothetical protein